MNGKVKNGAIPEVKIEYRQRQQREDRQEIEVGQPGAPGIQIDPVDGDQCIEQDLDSNDYIRFMYGSQCKVQQEQTG